MGEDQQQMLMILQDISKSMRDLTERVIKLETGSTQNKQDKIDLNDQLGDEFGDVKANVSQLTEQQEALDESIQTNAVHTGEVHREVRKVENDGKKLAAKLDLNNQRVLTNENNLGALAQEARAKFNNFEELANFQDQKMDHLGEEHTILKEMYAKDKQDQQKIEMSNKDQIRKLKSAASTLNRNMESEKLENLEFQKTVSEALESNEKRMSEMDFTKQNDKVLFAKEATRLIKEEITNQLNAHKGDTTKLLQGSLNNLNAGQEDSMKKLNEEMTEKLRLMDERLKKEQKKMEEEQETMIKMRIMEERKREEKLLEAEERMREAEERYEKQILELKAKSFQSVRTEPMEVSAVDLVESVTNRIKTYLPTILFQAKIVERLKVEPSTQNVNNVENFLRNVKPFHLVNDVKLHDEYLQVQHILLINNIPLRDWNRYIAMNCIPPEYNVSWTTMTYQQFLGTVFEQFPFTVYQKLKDKEILGFESTLPTVSGYFAEWITKASIMPKATRTLALVTMQGKLQTILDNEYPDPNLADEIANVTHLVQLEKIIKRSTFYKLKMKPPVEQSFFAIKDQRQKFKSVGKKGNGNFKHGSFKKRRYWCKDCVCGSCKFEQANFAKNKKKEHSNRTLHRFNAILVEFEEADMDDCVVFTDVCPKDFATGDAEFAMAEVSDFDEMRLMVDVQTASSSFHGYEEAYFEDLDDDGSHELLTVDARPCRC